MKRIVLLSVFLLVSAPAMAMMMQEEQQQSSSIEFDFANSPAAKMLSAPFKIAWSAVKTTCLLTGDLYRWATKPTPPAPPKKPNTPNTPSIEDVLGANKAQMDKVQAQVAASGMLARATSARYTADNAGAELIRRGTVKRGMREIWKQKPISKRVGLRK